MMELQVLGTGSDGNCYLLKADDDILILDCGISTKAIKKALNYDLSKVNGCFVTHKHSDHAEYSKDCMLMGIPMYEPYKQSKNRVNYFADNFVIQAFKVPHNDVDCYGALIRHKNGETAIYLTDFSYTKYIFKACKVNHFIVEVNWQKEFVDMDAPNYQHKVSGHCSLDTCRAFLKANETPYMKNIILVHHSPTTCDIEKCCEIIHNDLNENVYVDYAINGENYILQNGKKDSNE